MKGDIKNIENLIVHEVDLNTTSFEIGTASKGGRIKIYCNPADKEAGEKIVDNALELFERAIKGRSEIMVRLNGGE